MLAMLAEVFPNQVHHSLYAFEYSVSVDWYNEYKWTCFQVFGKTKLQI